MTSNVRLMYLSRGKQLHNARQELIIKYYEILENSSGFVDTLCAMMILRNHYPASFLFLHLRLYQDLLVSCKLASSGFNLIKL